MGWWMHILSGKGRKTVRFGIGGDDECVSFFSFGSSAGVWGFWILPGKLRASLFACAVFVLL
jgi:hypothetical protein